MVTMVTPWCAESHFNNRLNIWPAVFLFCVCIYVLVNSDYLSSLQSKSHCLALLINELHISTDIIWIYKVLSRAGLGPNSEVKKFFDPFHPPFSPLSPFRSLMCFLQLQAH